MSKKVTPEAHIFYADTRFERLARRTGGVERELALTRAQTQVDEMKSGFSEWLDGELQGLSAALSQAEGNPSDMSSLDRAYDSCCQLRDVGTTMGYELVTFVAGNLCEILKAIKAGAVYDKDTVDCHINAFFLAKAEQYRHLRPEQVPEMASGLRRVVKLANLVPTLKGK